MARLNWGRAFSNTADFLREKIARDLAEKNRREAAETQHKYDLELLDRRQTADQQSAVFSASVQDPMRARRLSRAGYDVPSGLLPTPRESIAPLMDELASASEPLDLPSPNALVNRLRGEGVESPYYGGKSPTIGGKQQVGHPIGVDDEETNAIGDLLRQRDEQEASIERELQLAENAQEFYDDESGATFRGLRGGGLVQTGPSLDERLSEHNLMGDADLERAKELKGTPSGDSASEGGQLAAVVNRNPELWEAIPASAKVAIAPELEALGFDFSSPQRLTPSMEAGNRGVSQTISLMKQLDAGLTQEAGFQGRVEGWVQYLQARLGMDVVAETYDSLANSALALMARARGDVANIAWAEQENYQRLWPQVTDPLPYRLAKYMAIEAMTDAAMGNPGSDNAWIEWTQFLPQVLGDGDTNDVPVESDPPGEINLSFDDLFGGQ